MVVTEKANLPVLVILAVLRNLPTAALLTGVVRSFETGSTPRAGRWHGRSQLVAEAFACGLPLNSLDLPLCRMFWRTWFPFTRLVSIIKGVRSMSIGRLSAGSLLVRRWSRGHAPLPVD
jgi:hypothetical protein